MTGTDAAVAGPRTGASRAPVLVFVAALAVRLAFVVLDPANVPVTPDKLSRYDQIAANLLVGEGFKHGTGPSALSPPAYPLLIAATFAVTGPSQTASRVVLAVLDAGVCVIFFILARRFLGPLESALTALALAFSPYLVYLVLTAGSDDLFLMFLGISLLLLGGAAASGRRLEFAAAGVAVGLATLTRATSLLLPLALIAAVLLASRNRRRAMGSCAVLLAAFVLTLAPWTIRNAVRFGRFVPVQTLGGMHFVIATSSKEQREAWLRDRHTQTRPRSPVANDSRMYGKAFEHIAADPIGFVRGTGRRMVRMWYVSHSSRLDPVLAPINFTLLLLAALGAWMVRSKWRELLPFYATFLYFVAVHSVMAVIFRYLVPVVPILVMLAAVPVAHLLRRLANRRLTAISEPRSAC